MRRLLSLFLADNVFFNYYYYFFFFLIIILIVVVFVAGLGHKICILTHFRTQPYQYERFQSFVQLLIIINLKLIDYLFVSNVGLQKKSMLLSGFSICNFITQNSVFTGNRAFGDH